MGTRAQIDVRSGNKVVRIYSQFDGFPHNILPALRAAASSRLSKPLSIARAIIRQFPDDFDIQVIDEDRSDYVSYRYAVDVSSKPWRVRQTRMAEYELPTNPDGSYDAKGKLLAVTRTVTRSFRIGQSEKK